MSYGFVVYNSRAQPTVLVHSDLSHFHFLGLGQSLGLKTTWDANALAYPVTLSSANQYFQGSGGHTVYTVRSPVSGNFPCIPFIKPNTFTEFACVLQQQYRNGYLEFDIMTGGVGVACPDIYLFAKADNTPFVNESHGILVYKADSSIAFDSRRRPLVITQGGLIQPPTIPMNGGDPGTGVYENSMGWSECDIGSYISQTNWDFNTGGLGTYTETGIAPQLAVSDVIYSIPSVAQAAYSIKRHHYHCDGCSSWWDPDEHHTANMEYGVFYRSGFRITANGYFQAGWIPLKYKAWASAQRATWAPWGGGECSGSDTVGFPFYANTINNGVDNMFLFSKASLYV